MSARDPTMRTQGKGRVAPGGSCNGAGRTSPSACRRCSTRAMFDLLGERLVEVFDAVVDAGVRVPAMNAHDPARLAEQRPGQPLTTIIGDESGLLHVDRPSWRSQWGHGE